MDGMSSQGPYPTNVPSRRILLAGIGGQGVLFAHQLLAEAAVALGLDVTGAETHGMSQRGGSVVSHLKIGNGLAPLIRQSSADFVLAFDAAEAYRNLSFLRPGGTLVVNSAQTDFPEARVSGILTKMGIRLQVVDADGIAARLGRTSAANVAVLGCASTCADFPLPGAALRETLGRVSPDRFLEMNLAAFDQGAGQVDEAV